MLGWGGILKETGGGGAFKKAGVGCFVEPALPTLTPSEEAAVEYRGRRSRLRSQLETNGFEFERALCTLKAVETTNALSAFNTRGQQPDVFQLETNGF